MKYYKCINEEGWLVIKEDVIYPEYHHEFSIEYVKFHPDDFEEVSKLEYIKQQGWYIQGSNEFKKWLNTNKDKIDKHLLDGHAKNTFYYLNDNKRLRAKAYENVPKGKVKVTIEELDQLYNPQVIVIKHSKVHHSNEPKYPLKHLMRNFNTNQTNKMENFQVKVTEYTFPILQDIAISNGYKWAIENTMSYRNDIKCIHFSISSKTIHYSRFLDSEDAYPLISLEEAIERICVNDLKEGDWVYFHGGNEGIVTQHWEKGIVGKIEKIETDVEKNCGSGTIVELHDFEGVNDITGFRRATEDEIKNRLIEIAKEKGLLCKRWKFNNKTYVNVALNEKWQYFKNTDGLYNDIGTIYYNGKWAIPLKDPLTVFGYKVQKTTKGRFQFGCSNHIYTKDELSRIIATLSRINDTVTVKEIVDELEKVEEL